MKPEICGEVMQNEPENQETGVEKNTQMGLENSGRYSEGLEPDFER